MAGWRAAVALLAAACCAGGAAGGIVVSGFAGRSWTVQGKGGTFWSLISSKYHQARSPGPGLGTG